MKILLATLTALFTLSSFAWAACPMGTTYSCIQGLNGKVICGCR